MKKDFKKIEGITLIALVVTIIILLILAGVSINMIVEDNGIVNKAKSGAENYQKTANEEMSKVANLQNIFESNTLGSDEPKGTIILSATPYSGNYDGTAHDALTNVTVDPSDCMLKYKLNDGEYTEKMPQVTGAEEYTVSIKASKKGYKTETITETVKVEQGSAGNFTVTLPYSTVEYTGREITPIVTVKDGSTILTENIDYIVTYTNNIEIGTVIVTVTGQGNYTGTKTATFNIIAAIPEGLKVGSIVSYSPSGTYNWNKAYASSDQTGSTTLSSASGQNFNINSWKVLSINETTGQVEMVPTAQTSGTVRLQGAQGYNNCVKLLNDACSSLYSNSSKGITARSINMDDIEKIIIDKNGYDPTTYSNEVTYYGNQTASAYSKANSYYPAIYEQEKNSVINGSKLSSGLGLSEQTSLISRTASSATNGYLQASTSIQPYQTFYGLNYTNFQNYLGTTYKDIILPSGTSTTYWVASRCVGTYSSSCSFLVRNVYSGYLKDNVMFGSSNGTGYCSRAVFPVVSLSSELISGNEVDGFSVN